jgi:hypothetical protein
MHGRVKSGVGCVVALGVAALVACSSSNGGPLAGNPGASSSGGSVTTGADGGDPCPSGTAVSDGQNYVTNRGCPKCHGSDMAGQTTYLHATPDGGAYPFHVYLYPPNLTPDQTTGIGSWRDEDVSFAIIHGVDNTSQRLCPEMQHYTGMCQSEADTIVKYLRSIPAVVKTIPSSICPPLKPLPPGFDAGP